MYNNLHQMNAHRHVVQCNRMWCSGYPKGSIALSSRSNAGRNYRSINTTTLVRLTRLHTHEGRRCNPMYRQWLRRGTRNGGPHQAKPLTSQPSCKSLLHPHLHQGKATPISPLTVRSYKTIRKGVGSERVCYPPRHTFFGVPMCEVVVLYGLTRLIGRK